MSNTQSYIAVGIPNKLLKTDSQRAAFLVPIGFCV